MTKREINETLERSGLKNHQQRAEQQPRLLEDSALELGRRLRLRVCVRQRVEAGGFFIGRPGGRVWVVAGYRHSF